MADLSELYHELLGIPPAEQPPNHYRLLGVTLFEANRQVITNAALKQSKFLRSLATSQYGEHCQTLLNQVATAKLCLLNEEKKQAYDAQLQAPSTPAAVDCSAPVNGKATVEQVAPPNARAAPQAPAASQAPAVHQAPANVAASGPTLDTAATVTINREWIVGWDPSCDLVVDSPTVSAIHCRLTEDADGQFWLEDLHSRNGTYVNRVPISGKVRVTRQHRITLGKQIPLPWPK
jgi:hypothetical protein